VCLALSHWGDARITLALDTTRLFKTWCLICVSLTYRGRAIPLAWRLLRHSSSTVGIQDIRPVLVSVHNLLSHLPEIEEVYIGADRGFMDRALMRVFMAYGWHWNIRGKGHVYVYDAQGKALGQIRQQLSQHGQAVYLHDVYLTRAKFGPVHLAAIHPPGAKEPWFIVSGQPCGPQTFDEYAGRFQIEEGFLDLKSGGFQLEDTRLRNTTALEGLIFVLALTSVFLFSEGTQVVDEGQRSSVDPHHRRGLSYFQIGWRAIRQRLTRRIPFLQRLMLSSDPDPEPSRRPRAPPVQYAGFPLS